MNEKLIQRGVPELQQILKFFVYNELAYSKYLINAIFPGKGRRVGQGFKKRFVV